MFGLRHGEGSGHEGGLGVIRVDRGNSPQRVAGHRSPSIVTIARSRGRWEANVAAKFVVKKGSTGKFRFNLVASNGEVIATSEAYSSKASAMKGIESVRKNAPTAAVDDQTTGS